jgi:hypothetical protein
LKLFTAAALVAASFGAAAPAAADTWAPEACQVHVYPADGVHSVGDDFDNVHELDQDVRHYYDMAGKPLDWLTPARQIDLIRGSQLPALAGPGAAAATFHPEPLTRRQAIDLAPSSSGDCVVDILIPQILLERGALSGRSLRIFGMVRRSQRGAVVQRYSGYASAPMIGFQLRSAADAPSATHLVETAYVSAVETLLRNSTKTKK